MQLKGGIKTGGLLSPALLTVGNWKRLIPVPWKELIEVVELGLWSILSRAPTVNKPFRRDAGHTTPSFSKRSHTDVAIQSSSSITLSYEMLIPI